MLHLLRRSTAIIPHWTKNFSAMSTFQPTRTFVKRSNAHIKDFTDDEAMDAFKEEGTFESERSVYVSNMGKSYFRMKSSVKI